jgi:hypothetical protein
MRKKAGGSVMGWMMFMDWGATAPNLEQQR